MLGVPPTGQTWAMRKTKALNVAGRVAWVLDNDHDIVGRRTIAW